MALSLLQTLLVLAVGVATWLWWQLRRPAGYPPGPAWMPVVGNFLHVRRLARQLGSQYQAFAHLAQQYNTPILGLRLGADLNVVVSSRQLIRDMLTRQEFEGRPKNLFADLRTLGLRKGVTLVDGPLWREQRAFLQRYLRVLGFTGTAMQSLVEEEVQEVVQHLKAAGDRPLQLKPLLAPVVLNTLFHFIAGIRFPRGDGRLDELLVLMEKRSRAFDMAGGTLSVMPWLRFILPEWSGYSSILNFNSVLRSYVTNIIADHKATFEPEKRRDLIDAFLYEMNKAKESGDIDTTFTDDQLLMLVYDLFVAGSETTSNSIRFAFLMMLLHPEAQKRVYNEIKEVVGTEKYPTLEDKDRMVYTRAAIMESQRMCYVIPVRGARRVLQDTTLGGYNLPKDTIILTNMWSHHMDKEFWGDPEVYRPERFITENGQLRDDDSIVPFGLGRRRCIGEALAKSCLFQVFTGILQNFELIPANGSLPKVSNVYGINLAPKPYDIIFKPR